MGITLQRDHLQNCQDCERCTESYGVQNTKKLIIDIEPFHIKSPEQLLPYASKEYTFNQIRHDLRCCNEPRISEVNQCGHTAGFCLRETTNTGAASSDRLRVVKGSRMSPKDISISTPFADSQVFRHSGGRVATTRNILVKT